VGRPYGRTTLPPRRLLIALRVADGKTRGPRCVRGMGRAGMGRSGVSGGRQVSRRVIVRARGQPLG
jgi:hypothetical protein